MSRWFGPDKMLGAVGTATNKALELKRGRLVVYHLTIRRLVRRDGTLRSECKGVAVI